jgi:hypothetical protein
MTGRRALTALIVAAAASLAGKPARALVPEGAIDGDRGRRSWVTEAYDNNLFGNADVFTHPRAWRRSFYGSQRSADRFLQFTDGAGAVEADRFLKYSDGRGVYRRRPRLSLPYAEQRGYQR